MEPPGVLSAGGGGGGEPTLLWSADFVNGTYAVDGSPAAVGDMFVEDQDDWGSSYSAADIVGGVGYRPAATGTQGPVLTGAARTAILSGFTLVGEINLPGTTVFFCDFHERLNYGTEYETRLSPSLPSLKDYVGATVFLSAISAGAHKFALTYIEGSMAISVDGGAVETFDPAAAWDPAPDALAFSVNGSGGAGHASIKTLTAYAAVDNGGLPELSTP